RDDNLFRFGIIDRLHRRAVPHHGDGRGRDDAADPGELDWIEVAGAAQDLAEREAVQEYAERGAILRGHTRQVAGRTNPAAAVHVPDQDAWATRDVTAEMRGQHARINVVAAAGREADVKVDRLAAIEVLDWVGERRAPRQQCQPDHRRRPRDPSSD